MKKRALYTLIIAIVVTSCGTIQSIVKSTFPYTSTLIIPASSKTNTTLTATSSASSFDQIFTGQGSNQISQVRVASVKLESINPTNQNLGILKSAKVYLLNSSSETLIATRTDIASTVGRAIMLDIDNSKFLDEYLKSGNVRIRLEYVLQSGLNTDISIKASIGLNAMPASTN